MGLDVLVEDGKVNDLDDIAVASNVPEGNEELLDPIEPIMAEVAAACCYTGNYEENFVSKTEMVLSNGDDDKVEDAKTML